MGPPPARSLKKVGLRRALIGLGAWHRLRLCGTLAGHLRCREQHGRARIPLAAPGSAGGPHNASGRPVLRVRTVLRRCV